MFVYQNGKLYSQKGDKLIGVEIYSDNSIIEIEGAKPVKREANSELLELFEVMARFPKKDVMENESVDNIKKPTRRKSSAK